MRDSKGAEMKHTVMVDVQGTRSLRYHATDVVTVGEYNVTLDSGGWLTATTKKRIQQASELFGLKMSVYQTGGEWFVALADGAEIPFSDGMRISLDLVTA